MIELLQAMGLGDISAALWGFLAGTTLVALWISAWFVGESIFNRLLEPGFAAHADQALAVGNDTPAEQTERAERFHNWGVTR